MSIHEKLVCIVTEIPAFREKGCKKDDSATIFCEETTSEQVSFFTVSRLPTAEASASKREGGKGGIRS